MASLRQFCTVPKGLCTGRQPSLGRIAFVKLKTPDLKTGKERILDDGGFSEPILIAQDGAFIEFGTEPEQLWQACDLNPDGAHPSSQ